MNRKKYIALQYIYSTLHLQCISMVCYICEYMLVHKLTLRNQPKQTDKVKNKRYNQPFPAMQNE